ncbi:hypothetical protein [Pyrobaculum sp.]|uniref:hypothetical protein n=1 Tax=Pyrobaculum sp. TaxID=2004705 RepID=UPI003D10B255
METDYLARLKEHAEALSRVKEQFDIVYGEEGGRPYLDFKIRGACIEPSVLACNCNAVCKGEPSCVERCVETEGRRACEAKEGDLRERIKRAEGGELEALVSPQMATGMKMIVKKIELVSLDRGANEISMVIRMWLLNMPTAKSMGRFVAAMSACIKQKPPEECLQGLDAFAV